MKNTYIGNKKRILRIYSSILSDIRVDKNDGEISSSNIKNIGEGIGNFSTRLEELQKLFSDIQRKYSGDSFVSEEGKWIVGFSVTFNAQLQQWLHFHKNELNGLSGAIEDAAGTVANMSLEQGLLQHQGIINTQIHQINKLL